MLLYVFLFAIVQFAQGIKLPEEITNRLCHRSDPNLNACLMDFSRYGFEQLKKGIPELGLDPIDPMHIDFATTEADLDVIKIKMIMKNITTTGQSELQINKIKFDPKSLRGYVSYSVPNIRMMCDYFATGQLFVIPLESSAHFDGNFTGIDIAASFRLGTMEKRGKEYFTIEELTVKSHFGKAHIKLDSIDPANQQAVNVIQDFFNENDRLVLDTVNPIVNVNGAQHAKRIAEIFLRLIPSEEIFPY